MKPTPGLSFIIATLSLLTFGCRNAGNSEGDKFITAHLNVNTDSIPAVFACCRPDIIAARLKNEAYNRFVRFQLPRTKQELEEFRTSLKEQINDRAGIIVDHDLPLQMEEQGYSDLNGYLIKNIIFQTLPGLYATANLYIPDGQGPFPAVMVLHGHWTEARLCSPVQSVALALVLQGYVTMTIDAFGAGERSAVHGTFDYHGANPGASLMNVGKTLLGIQVSENMRGIDLLCSLPVVDPKRIGATGASGGGNQTMWLTALDERVKAAVPVVSVGTFESYIMGSNCVCELLPDGLTLTEESGILALMAPRAVMLCNHLRESNPTFFPAEMLRSYNIAKPVFDLLGAGESIGYRLFDLEHDYAKEDREAMLGWFERHLKGTGNGEAMKERSFITLPMGKLMAFPDGKPDLKVANMEEFLRQSGKELRKSFLETKSFNVKRKVKELQDILRINENPGLARVYHYPRLGGWNRMILETSDGRLLPLLHIAPRDKWKGYVILCNPKGNRNIPAVLLNDLTAKGSGIVLADLTGTGENVSSTATAFEGGVGDFHTLSRAYLWLGKTAMGEWVKELDLIVEFLKEEYQPASISIDGSREAGLAALFYAATEGNSVSEVILREAPPSYLFDSRKGIDFFSMAIHLPGFLCWGDISLAAAMSGKDITFISPVTMSGNTISKAKLNEYRSEFDNMRKTCGKTGRTSFN